jgi:hypothetical protein
LKNYRWFLSAQSSSPFPLSASSPNPTKLSCGISSLSISWLWHARMGHLAIQFLNRTIKHKCVSGIPAVDLSYPLSKCHSCSMSKSLHKPVQSPP